MSASRDDGSDPGVNRRDSDGHPVWCPAREDREIVDAVSGIADDDLAAGVSDPISARHAGQSRHDRQCEAAGTGMEEAELIERVQPQLAVQLPLVDEPFVSPIR